MRRICSIQVRCSIPSFVLPGTFGLSGRIAVAAAVQRQAVHVAGADVEVAAPLGVGRDLVPQLPRPRQQRRSVGVVVGAVLVVVHDEPDRDALPQGDESRVGQEPLEAVGEELGRAAVAGVVEVAGVAEVALEDHRGRRPCGRLQQPLVALVARRSDQLVTAGAEQREAVSVPGQPDVVQRGDRLRRARQRPQAHAPADVAIGSDLVERGQREPVDDLFGAVVEPAAGHRPFEPDAGRVGAPHAHAHVVAAVQARAGDARDQHRRDRAGRLRPCVRGDGVAVHLQPAWPQAEGVHGQDAGVPGRGRHRPRDLPVRLRSCPPATPSPRRGRPGSGRPARGACPPPPGRCLRWQRCGGRRRRTPRSPAGRPRWSPPRTRGGRSTAAAAPAAGWRPRRRTRAAGPRLRAPRPAAARASAGRRRWCARRQAPSAPPGRRRPAAAPGEAPTAAPIRPGR